jgi:hypothetical protein
MTVGMTLYSIMSLLNFVISESKLKCEEEETDRHNDDILAYLLFLRM